MGTAAHGDRGTVFVSPFRETQNRHRVSDYNENLRTR